MTIEMDEEGRAYVPDADLTREEQEAVQIAVDAFMDMMEDELLHGPMGPQDAPPTGLIS